MIWAAFVLWLAAVDQSSAPLGGTRDSRRRSSASARLKPTVPWTFGSHNDPTILDHA